MDQLEPQSPNTPRRSWATERLRIHIEGDPVAIDSRDSNDPNYMLPPIRFNLAATQGPRNDDANPFQDPRPIWTESSDEVDDESESAWVRRMEEMRADEDQSANNGVNLLPDIGLQHRDRAPVHDDSRHPEYRLPAVRFNPRARVPATEDDPFSDDNRRPPTTDPSRQNSQTENRARGAPRFTPAAIRAAEQLLRQSPERLRQLGAIARPRPADFPPIQDLVHFDAESSSCLELNIPPRRRNPEISVHRPQSASPPISPHDSASQAGSPHTRRPLRVMDTHTPPQRDPRAAEYPLFDDSSSPSPIQAALAARLKYPRRTSSLPQTPVKGDQNNISPHQQQNLTQPPPPNIHLSPPSQPSPTLQRPTAARFRGHVRFSDQPLPNTTIQHPPPASTSQPPTSQPPTTLTTRLTHLQTLLSPWKTWALHSLILFNVWGLPISLSCYIEFYYNNLLPTTSLIKILSIASAQIFTLLFVTLSAHSLSQLGFQHGRGVRIMMVLGTMGTVVGNALAPLRGGAETGVWWWFFGTQGVLVGTALGVLNVAGTVTLAGYYDNDIVVASGMLRVSGGIGAIIYTAILHGCLQYQSDFPLSCYILAGISFITLVPGCVFLRGKPDGSRFPRQSITGTIKMLFSLKRLVFITGYCCVWFSLFTWPVFIVLYISEITWPATGMKVLLLMQVAAVAGYVVVGRESVQRNFGVLNVFIFLAGVAGIAVLVTGFSFHVGISYFVAVPVGFAVGGLLVLYVKVVYVFNVDIRGRARDNLARTAVLLGMAALAAAGGVFSVAVLADRGPGVVDGKVGRWGHDGWRNAWCVAGGGFLVGSLLLVIARAGLAGVGWDPLIIV